MCRIYSLCLFHATADGTSKAYLHGNVSLLTLGDVSCALFFAALLYLLFFSYV